MRVLFVCSYVTFFTSTSQISHLSKNVANAKRYFWCLKQNTPHKKNTIGYLFCFHTSFFFFCFLFLKHFLKTPVLLTLKKNQGPKKKSGTQQEGKSTGFLNNNQGPNKREMGQTTIDNILTILKSLLGSWTTIRDPIQSYLWCYLSGVSDQTELSMLSAAFYTQETICNHL